jgi:glycosyltransferase involved in cell wall biosynthesis
LEYIRADLPVIATVGDATGELILQHGLGRCVAYEADDQVAGAILDLLATPKSHFAAAFAHARDLLSWERAAAPLIHYCQQPWRAADKQGAAAAVVQRAQWSGHDQAYAELVVEQQRQAALIAAYEQGNFMRLMRNLAAIKRTFLGPQPPHAEPPG